MINYYLKQTPPETSSNLEQYRHLILDGTFIRRPRSLIAVMDAKTHTLIAGQYGVPENSEPKLIKFLAGLKQFGLNPHSFTVDGNRVVMEVIRKLWPSIIVQRCLVHIQRQGLSWCRISPKTTYARHLRKVFLQVTRIRTGEDRSEFLSDVIEWEVKFGERIRERRKTGYVLSDIKRARSMLLRALPDMFHYLDDPMIPISTNGLEGYFSRLKGHYRQHRGLRKEKLKNYFQWYFHFILK